MSGCEVHFGHGPVGVMGDGVGVVLNRSPEVRNEPITVVRGFRPDVFQVIGRAKEQNRAGAEERFNEVRDVPEAFPNERCDTRLSAKPRCLRERRAILKPPVPVASLLFILHVFGSTDAARARSPGTLDRHGHSPNTHNAA